MQSFVRTHRMACWVVPALAAEFWGISVDQVMGRVVDGSVGSKIEDGFLFVDVAPHALPFRYAPHERPPTFTLVTRSEQEALTGDLAEELGAIEAEELEDDDDEGAPPPI